jgi:hypothetical protein
MDTTTKPTDESHSDRSHHPTSPSSLQAREACPCYSPGSSGDNTASLRGTAQHEAVERGEITDEFSDEEAAAVALAMDIVADAERTFGTPKAPSIVLREQYLPIDSIPNGGWEGTTGGFADVIIISGDGRRGKVLDWKFGKFSVEPAVNNAQGIAYALGLVEHVRRTRGYLLDSVEVEFVSPHIEERSQHVFPKSEYATLYTRLRTIVERALLGLAQADAGNFSMANPTTTGCMFCARLKLCPVAAERFLSISKKYAPAEVPPGIDIRGLDLHDKEAAKKLLVVAALGARWGAEVRKRLTEEALNDDGLIPEGYQLIATYPRKVVDVRKFFELTKEVLSGTVSEEALWKILDMPITPVEKLIKDAAPLGQKGEAVEAFALRAEESGAVEKSTVPVVSLRMKGKSETK